MKAILILAAALAGFATAASAESGFLDRSVVVAGATYRYQVYVPPGYDGKSALPMVVDLHGIGLQGDDGLQQTTIGLAAAIRKNRARFPVIAVLPQDQAGKRWLDTDMEDLAMAELDATAREFRTDPARVYLTGFSMGATGAYRIAYRWPRRFAAVAVIAGRVTTADVKTYSEADKAADRVANPFVAEADPFAALARGLGALPVAIFHGDADTTVPVEQSRRLAAALRAAGGELRYSENPGGNHYDTAEKAYGDEDFMPWLLAHARKPAK
ncbi:PHB depolymerase family esterase [Phenylobacterium sp.]|uniref:carboxylesterase family protein n=1 Tax=Phenylobacterium sp. TaxID=1871053 RepID=UPI00120C3154|nr:PHB depolymerase family esterase [Phenylobacterium sp.]THD52089.1 MAG: phospholipase [Phenylobacterium sp.]